MNRAATVAAAFALDLIVGDPRYLPHPVRGIGALTTLGERVARRFIGRGSRRELVAGGILTGVVVVGSAFAARAAVALAALCAGSRAARGAEIVLAATTIAARDLLVESDAVLDALERGDLERARVRLSRIVGRDTARLDASDIARATIETLAESACDGIVAPFLALAVGGVPFAMAFKAASTLDSMIGHIEAPYTSFGRCAAKLDDLLCFAPARFSALAICLLAPLAEGTFVSAFATLRADGGRHRSPNAGRPEAAMAGALGVRLGGDNVYDGLIREGDFLGAAFPPPTCADARRAQTVVLGVALATAVSTSLLAWLARAR
jgi:adenosylcobinamide-phosphate synthase